MYAGHGSLGKNMKEYRSYLEGLAGELDEVMDSKEFWRIFRMAERGLSHYSSINGRKKDSALASRFMEGLKRKGIRETSRGMIIQSYQNGGTRIH